MIQSVHRVPITQRSKLKEALTKLEADGVIEDADGPSELVSNLVISQKRNRQLRLCLDPKPLNRAIKREPYVIPTAEGVQAQLADKRIFTLIDMKEAYWHVRLTERSSRLCTFHTPWGHKRFKRMPFGITSAGEVLQKRLQDVFGDIEGCHVIADDLIIAGNDEAVHDKVVCALIKRATANNVKFNPDKIQFKVLSVTYMGSIITDQGLQSDPAKVQAIVDYPHPKDKGDLRRFLEMVKYLDKFIAGTNESFTFSVSYQSKLSPTYTIPYVTLL